MVNLYIHHKSLENTVFGMLFYFKATKDIEVNKFKFLGRYLLISINTQYLLSTTSVGHYDRVEKTLAEINSEFIVFILAL